MRNASPTRSPTGCGSRESRTRATTSTRRSRWPTWSVDSTCSSRRCATSPPVHRCRIRSCRSSLRTLMRIATRLQGLEQSEIRRMTRECERVGGINLGQGICDLPTPELVRDGAIQAIRENRSTYSFAEGTVELREAIARKLARDNGLTADPGTEICVTVGASGAYACAIHALLDPGDGILFFEPYYGYHLNAAIVAGLAPEFVTLAPPDFSLNESALRAAITPRTRAVVLCTPSNPSGKMFSRAELQMVARVA